MELKLRNRSVAIVYSHGRKEYSFEIAVPDDQQAITGYDPEEAGSENPGLRKVLYRTSAILMLQ